MVSESDDRRTYQREWRAKNLDRLLEEGRANYARKKQADPEATLAAKRFAYRRSKERDPDAMRERGRQRQARYRATHPDRKPSKEQAREYSQRSRHRLRATVLSYYGGRCACCGETRNEFLCIDHEAGDGAAHRRSMGTKSGAGPIYRWLKLNDYPKGFRVLCHNCNMAYGFYGRCPHQTT